MHRGGQLPGGRRYGQAKVGHGHGQDHGQAEVGHGHGQDQDHGQAEVGTGIVFLYQGCNNIEQKTLLLLGFFYLDFVFSFVLPFFSLKSEVGIVFLYQG